MSHQFKKGDKCKTRDGRDARVIADDLTEEDFDVVGRRLAVIITRADGFELLTTRLANGRWTSNCETASDLMPPKVKLTLWYKDGKVCDVKQVDDYYVNEKHGWRKITVEEVDQ